MVPAPTSSYLRNFWSFISTLKTITVIILSLKARAVTRHKHQHRHQRQRQRQHQNQHQHKKKHHQPQHRISITFGTSIINIVFPIPLTIFNSLTGIKSSSSIIITTVVATVTILVVSLAITADPPYTDVTESDPDPLEC